MNILVTGGAGFIGSNFIRQMLRKSDQVDDELLIVNLDVLTYAGNLDNMKDIDNDPRYHFVQGDINNQQLVESIIHTYRIDGIVHCAAETHVDRSILSAQPFVKTNVGGTLVLLDAAKMAALRSLYISRQMKCMDH
jgi:dTDP-glucose 4,6-dehydratase